MVLMILSLGQDMDLQSNSIQPQVCFIKCDLIFYTYGEQSTSFHGAIDIKLNS